jgi:hypothetical protein
MHSPRPPLRHKFHAKPVELDGIKFPSKLEARRYGELKVLQAAGEVLFFLRQVAFHLPGGVRYVCDFEIFWADGRVTFEDAKGMATDTYKLKRRQVEALYPVTIEEYRR